MLSVVDRHGRSTAVQMVVYTLALMIVSLWPRRLLMTRDCTRGPPPPPAGSKRAERQCLRDGWATEAPAFGAQGAAGQGFLNL